MRTITLASGITAPVLGLGTWRFGEAPRRREAEIAAVRTALQLGYRLIDTAELYGDGGAESVVGEALRGALADNEVKREELVIVSKVLPQNATRAGTRKACERSLKRLGLDRIDLYLLHWRGSYPLSEVVEGFEYLKARGHIGAWGVSNFDVSDIDDLNTMGALPSCAANQVYYSATERGIEASVLPRLRGLSMPWMAYSPIDQGALSQDPLFHEIGRRYDASAAQAALAWVIRHPDVIAIPKASRDDHLRDNLNAAALQLDSADLARIDAKYPAPQRPRPLAMI